METEMIKNDLSLEILATRARQTVLVKFPLYCPKCKTEIIVDVIKFEMRKSVEPGA